MASIDEYFSNVALLVHCDANSSNGFYYTVDNSRVGVELRFYNSSSALSSAQYKFGPQSAYCNGDYAGMYTTGQDDRYVLGTNDFTIELWAYLISGGRYYTSHVDSTLWSYGNEQPGTIALQIAYGTTPPKIRLIGFVGSYSKSNLTPIPSTVPVGTELTNTTWHHIALTRAGNTFNLWVNGILYSSAAVPSGFSISPALNRWHLGCDTYSYRPFYGYVDEFRVTNGVARYTSAFTPSATAFPNKGGAEFTIAQTVNFSDLTYLGLFDNRALTDGPIISDATDAGKYKPKEAFDTFNVSDAAVYLRGMPATDGIKFFETLLLTPVTNVTDTITVSEDILCQWLYDLLAEDTTNFLDIPTTQAYYKTAFTDTVEITVALLLGVPVNLADQITISRALTVVQGLRVLEKLNLLDVSAAKSIRQLTILERARILDSLYKFFSGEVNELINVSETNLPSYFLTRVVTDALTVTDTLSKTLVFRVTASDQVNIDDVDILKYIYRPTLTDNIEISAAYISPGQNFTTWAVNSRTGAVTEYTNYNFNSFAALGHKYLAASDSGLYELNGEDDQGSDVIARIKSGLMQMGGSHFTSFKAAYLGLRGNGDWVFKLQTGDGKEYVYSIIAQDMQTTKVRLGKGLRARYFAFELISTGQDFDMDSVEFIPLIATRRV